MSKSSRTKAVNRSMTLRRNMKESEKKLKKKAKLEDSNKFFKDDIPVWLNSFLSILVPSCFLDPMDPTLDEKYKNKLSEVNKKHQTKVSEGSVVDIGNTHSTLLGDEVSNHHLHNYHPLLCWPHVFCHQQGLQGLELQQQHL